VLKSIIGVTAACLPSTHAIAIDNANLSGVITRVTTYRQRTTVTKATFAALVLVASFPVTATEYVKETKLASFSAAAERPAFAWGQNRELLVLPSSPGWTVSGGSGGSASCSQTVVVLPGGNTTIRAVALAAIASGATVLVYVDNTLPMLGDYCQVSNLSIEGQ
jgi:hypothetical protein